jgi:hypothetical protein
LELQDDDGNYNSKNAISKIDNDSYPHFPQGPAYEMIWPLKKYSSIGFFMPFKLFFKSSIYF